MSAPLQDILVVALEQAVAAPYLSSRLADAGARVIKVERAEGDFARRYDAVAQGESAYFVWLNRGKESISLDLKQPDDAALLRQMIGRADVFIQNLAPGAAVRAGFDSADLREEFPSLITVDISGYGEQGPYAQMKAYDLLLQCETGLASITGSHDAPGRVGVSVCDIACGMYAHAAVLEALLERQRSGHGKGLSVSLFDALADWMTVPLLHQQYGGAAPQRVGLHHPSIAPYGAYSCGDGEQVVISIQNEREWQNLCAEVLGAPALASDPRFARNTDRVAHRAELDREIAAVFDTLTRAQLIERLRNAGIAFGAVNDVAALQQHPQLRRQPVETPSGAVELVAAPVRVAGERRRFRPVPAVNQHGEALRSEFERDDIGRRDVHRRELGDDD